MIQSNPQQTNYFTSSNPSIFQTTFTNSPSLDLTDLPDHQHLHDERKQRRMISNRESARRSRMRKQRHLDELWSQVLRLRSDNHNLVEKLNQMSKSHDEVVKENARFKEEAKDLQRKLMDVQVGSSYSIFSDLDELSCNSAHLQAESCNHSLTPSTDLLH